MRDRSLYKPDVPSVTEIIERDYPFLGDKDPYFKKRGNWGHEVSHAIALKQTPPIVDTLAEIRRNQPDWDVSDWPYIATAYRAWLSQQRDATLIAVEQYVYSGFGDTFQGTYDQKWRMRTPADKREVVRIDLKVMTSGHCPETTRLQLAAYDIADNQRTVRLGLALHPDGTFDESWYTEFKHLRDYDVWRGMVRHWWMHNPNSREYR